MEVNAIMRNFFGGFLMVIGLISGISLVTFGIIFAFIGFPILGILLIIGGVLLYKRNNYSGSYDGSHYDGSDDDCD